MKARIYQNQYAGAYTDDFIIDNISKTINGELVGDWLLTDLLPNENLLKPFWSGSEWIDGATSEEINEVLIISQYNERIKTAFTNLRRRALGSSIGKKGSWEYLNEQAQQYKDKYNVAKGNYVNAIVSQMIADEANDFGIDEATMKSMIIQMFEAGELAYYQFTAMIERARTKAITMLDNSEFARALQVIELMESVPDTLTMQDAENLATQLISI